MLILSIIKNKKKKRTPAGVLFLKRYKLLILSLSSSLRLLLTLYAGLLIMLSLTKLGKNAGLLALSLKTTKCTIKSLIFFYSNFCHHYFPPFALQRDIIS